MINITINGKNLSVSEGLTILEAAREAGIVIPTLCYLKDLNEVGACRICVVEVKGADRLVAACNTKVSEGMEIETNSARVLETRKRNLQLILSAHDCNCLTCERNGKCRLQLLAQQMGLMEHQPYPVKVAKDKWDAALPLQRRDSRCISCLRCVSVCDKMQGMKVWDLLGLGSRAKVAVREGKTIPEVNCTFCGQCITHCPVGALGEREDTRRFLDAVNDPMKTVVLQIAPAVRTAWADEFGLSSDQATERRMVAAFRRLGAKYVFDTNFAADLTIMEEGSEFLEMLKGSKVEKLKSQSSPDSSTVQPFNSSTLFTSCCPGWVRFLKQEYPDMVGQLSSAKSPQLMFGAIAKSYFAKKIGKKPEDIFCVSVMPCLAKKWEAGAGKREEGRGMRDVDLVLTTREAARLLRLRGVEPANLPEEDFDSPLGTGSGAAVIFGATGGVMEAALRTAYFLVEGKNPDPDAFKAVRGIDGRKEVTVTLGGRQVRACVASGLANARSVVEDIRSGRAQYDFVEIMACPGGCAGGGGQPFIDGYEQAEERGQTLYGLDKANKIRFSHENPEVAALYTDFLEKPLSHTAHELLHTDQTTWKL